MALVTGGGAGLAFGGGGPAFTPAMVPPTMDFTSSFTSPTADASGPGGAWDLKAWERGAGAAFGPDSCICVSFGHELRASVWDCEKHFAVIVPLVASSSACCEGDVTAQGSGASMPSAIECSGSAASDTLEAVVTFAGGASVRRIGKWFDEDSSTRRYGGLPACVSVGAVDSETGLEVKVRPVQLLGMQSPAEANLEHKKVAVAPRSNCEGGVFSAGVEVHLQLPRPESHTDCQESAAELVLEPEDLVALLLAHIRRCCSEFTGDAPKPCMALAVPSWWGDVKRTAAASASSRASAEPLRIASLPVCIAVGIYNRRVKAGDCVDFQRVLAGGGSVLVVNVDADFVDVMLLEAFYDEGSTPSWRALTGGSGGFRPCGQTSGLPMLQAALEVVVHDAGCKVQGIAAVVLVGQAEAEPVLAALASLPRPPAVLRAEPHDAAAGLACLIAAELGGEKEPIGTAADALPEAVGFVVHPVGCLGTDALAMAGDVETIFDRGCAVPSSARRKLVRGMRNGGGNLDIEIAIAEGSTAKELNWKRHSVLSSVLTQVSDDGTFYPCESAELVLQLDASGLLSVEIQEAKSTAMEYAAKQRSWRKLAFLLIVAALLVTSAWISTLGLSSSGGTASQQSFRPRLEAFMRQHNPHKMRDIDEWLDKYSGRELVLQRRLEKKYGASFPVGRGSGDL